MSYLENFKEAIERNKRLGLKSPDVEFHDNKQYITSQLIQKFPYALRDKFGELEVEQLAGQCLSVNLELKEFISDFLQCPVYYTIGHIIQNSGHKYFYQSEETLQDMLKNGVNGMVVNIHAWLTLPSMEIIDPTFLTSYSLVNNFKEGLGGIISIHADKVQHMNFIPMLIGEDFIGKAGLIKGFYCKF